jgi:ligand-binding sensor domain-containing protein
MDTTALERVLAILEKIWLRLLSPSGMRLLAPLIAIAVVAVGWRAWRAAGTTALGRALRWWLLAGSACVVLGAVVYLQVVVPDDPEAAAAARSLALERPGTAALSAPLALWGAVVAVLAGFIALGHWRRAGSAAEDWAALGALRLAGRRWRRRAAGVVAAALAAAGAAFAAAAGAAPQVPVPITPNPAAPPRTSGSLWVGTTAGLSRLRPTEAGGRWEGFARPRSPLPSDQVTGIAAGPGGQVWVSTTRGLAAYAPDGSDAGWQTETTVATGRLFPTALGLAVDGGGAIWAATAGGAIVVDSRGGDRAFTTLNAPLLHQILDAVYVDPSGRIWLGGAGGVNVYTPLGPDTTDGEWSVGFNRFSTGGALPDNQVFAIVGDSTGRIWFGTGAGVAVLTPAPGAGDAGAYEPARWRTFTPANSPLVHPKVHAIAEDRQGNIWLGTEGGISVVSESGLSSGAGWQRHVADQGAGGPKGLPDPWVQALQVGPDGRVWAGTRRGLALLDPAQPAQGWTTYAAHPLRRWTGMLWPSHWQQHPIGSHVTAIKWVP